jgi:uncharacterized protein
MRKNRGPQMTSARIEIPVAEIAAICRKWRIEEMSVFGSALRDDFNEGSDIDLLVRFEKNAGWSLFDWMEIAEEFEAAFGRKVDLVAESGLRNPFRRREILATREIVYAA